MTFYKWIKDKLCMHCIGVEEVSEQKARVAMLEIGESKIELLEPTMVNFKTKIFVVYS